MDIDKGTVMVYNETTKRKGDKIMVIAGKIIGMLILWIGVAMYPLANEDDTPQAWHKFFQNLCDSFPIMIGALLLTCL